MPVAQMRRGAANAGGGLGIDAGEGAKQEGDETSAGPSEEHEVPHARGPDVIGMEDMGPQGKAPGSGLDMEAAVGRPRTEEKKEGVRGEDRVMDVETGVKGW